MVVDDDVVELVVVARVVVVVVARVVIVVVVSSATGIGLFSSLKETTKEINKIKIITKIFDLVDRSKNLFQRDENNFLYNLNIGIKKLFKNNGKNILKNLLIALKRIFIVLKRVFIFLGYSRQLKCAVIVRFFVFL